MKEKTRCGM